MSKRKRLSYKEKLKVCKLYEDSYRELAAKHHIQNFALIALWVLDNNIKNTYGESGGLIIMVRKTTLR